MENNQQQSKLEIFLIIVSVFVVVDLLFWTVVTKFFPGLFGGGFSYRFISLFFGILFCSIPIITGILIKNQSTKILLIVLGSIALLVRITFFVTDLLKSFF